MFKDLFSLQGRVALVTGGSRGIGKMIAAGFLSQGAARVYITARKAGPCEATAKELTAEYGGECVALPIDISTLAGIDMLAAEIKKREPKLDILVNNAGVLRDNLLFKMSEDDWETVMNVHLKGAFLCSRAAQKYMVQQRYGRIVSLSSTAALGNRGQANYSTAKAGLQGLTRTLAIELGPFGITVNAIGPGFIDTEMTRSTARRRGLDPDAVIVEASKNIPVRRVGQPRDVANVICFLSSEEASFVSGQVIYVAGGPRS